MTYRDVLYARLMRLNRLAADPYPLALTDVHEETGLAVWQITVIAMHALAHTQHELAGYTEQSVTGRTER